MLQPVQPLTADNFEDILDAITECTERHSITYTTSLPCVELSSERPKCSADYGYSFGTISLAHVRFATVPGNFSTVERQKMLRGLQFFNIFTSERAFRHSGVQFFDIGTSKSGPNMRCFVHFDFQMCISPQRRAIFRHLNRQKWSRIVSFLAFSLPNVLFATVACNFSTSERPKVVQTCGVLYILTCKCAFRHSGVQFFDI